MTHHTNDARACAHLAVTLPYPPSANRYWRTRVVNNVAMAYVSAEAKAFKEQVGWLLRAAGVREVIKGRVQVDIVLYAKRPQDWQKRQRLHGAHWDDTVQRIDLDNARKVLYDSLKNIAIEDDFWIWKDSGEVAEPDAHGARVVVTITPIVVDQPQAGLALELASSPASSAISSGAQSALFDPLAV